MERRAEMNVPKIVLSVFGVITFAFVVSFVYLSLNGTNYNESYNSKIQEGEIINPIKEFALSIFDNSEKIPEDAKIIKIQTDDGEKIIVIQANVEGVNISDIEKEVVNYGAVILKLYNLHNIPFTSITPKIQVFIGNNSYNIEVKEGDMILKNGMIDNEDIIIRTTHEEIFSIIKNQEYAKESLSLGKTSIEPVANKFILFSKGYSSLYSEFEN